ncbi:MAG: hypothetical protein ACTSPB_00920 [Candidatus Thorarchaeota archaeon]
MLDIPEEIQTFVKNATETYQHRGVNIESVYAAKISQAELQTGSGICLKMEEVPLNNKSPNPDQSAIRFVISDGNYAVECMAHNGSIDSRPGGMSSDKLRQVMMLLTRSIRNGSQLVVCGAYQMMGRDKVFVITDVQPFETLNSSQMTKEQFDEFISLCKAAGPTFRPLEMMIRDDTLWSKLFAQDPLKYATMLYCLSPQKKTDMLHIGIVTSMGEGKDHLIEQVIEPLVPCGVASSGKLCTIPGLFGAMSGEDLNSIELGLIPKMNKERIAISEFQTWGQEVFGELMNVMANGMFTMQKGQVDTKRDAKVNFMFLGNPPKSWNPKERKSNPDGTNNKLGMLDAFGEYTYQILSRLTLIFARMSLTDGDHDYAIEDKIMDSMNGKYQKEEFTGKLVMWRTFFREYLRYVSETDPDITPVRMEIRKQMEMIKSNPDFIEAFLDGGRSSRDFRKFQEFVNLCKGFARLNGEATVSPESINSATRLFMDSLETLIRDTPWKSLQAGATTKHQSIYTQLNDHSEEGVYTSVKEMRKVVMFSNADWNTMINLRWIEANDDDPNKANYIQILPQDLYDEEDTVALSS